MRCRQLVDNQFGCDSDARSSTSLWTHQRRGQALGASVDQRSHCRRRPQSGRCTCDDRPRDDSSKRDRPNRLHRVRDTRLDARSGVSRPRSVAPSGASTWWSCGCELGSSLTPGVSSRRATHLIAAARNFGVPAVRLGNDRQEAGPSFRSRGSPDETSSGFSRGVHVREEQSRASSAPCPRRRAA